MPKRGKNAKQLRGLQQMIDVTEQLGLYDVESDGRVLRELLESAADLKAYGLVSPEDEALLAGITTSGEFTLEEALRRYADVKRLRVKD